jgi:hypothetical protein
LAGGRGGGSVKMLVNCARAGLARSSATSAIDVTEAAEVTEAVDANEAVDEAVSRAMEAGCFRLRSGAHSRPGRPVNTRNTAVKGRKKAGSPRRFTIRR